ncbi:MAG: lipoyl synthase, partial [Candidatus Marinimicrobia bacterium]|nr:lipoyl synthase [Candidatus Neomarinimicrobiota bacterium]
SVTRDDLPDGGAAHFAAAIAALRAASPAGRIEVLTPDFQGCAAALRVVAAAAPDVFNHNLETVARLQPRVRPQADYARSLEVLRFMHAADPARPTKSGLMLGLGETDAEVETALADLRAAGVSLLTLGQYMAPSAAHVPVARYVEPRAFAAWAVRARELGFRGVASGPLVRSSYQAAELWRQAHAS